MIDAKLLLQVTAKEHGLSVADIQGPSRHRKVVKARKMVCLIMRGTSSKEIAELINRSPDNVRHHQLEMMDMIDLDPEIQNTHDRILSQIKTDMTIKLKPSQLESLHEVLEHYLSQKPDDISTELIHLHIRDISERVRKRILNRKKNLNLEEKQIKAFVIWHLHFSERYRDMGHAYLTIQDMIGQIKPEYGKSITYQ